MGRQLARLTLLLSYPVCAGTSWQRRMLLECVGDCSNDIELRWILDYWMEKVFFASSVWQSSGNEVVIEKLLEKELLSFYILRMVVQDLPQLWEWQHTSGHRSSAPRIRCVVWYAAAIMRLLNLFIMNHRITSSSTCYNEYIKLCLRYLSVINKCFFMSNLTLHSHHQYCHTLYNTGYVCVCKIHWHYYTYTFVSQQSVRTRYR